MMTDAWNQQLDRHEAFLECRPVDRPLIHPWASGYYPAEQFPCGTAHWQTGAILRPEDVCFAPFADDYERLYESQRNSDGDFGYVGSAYWGIPWLEAIMGCPVAVATANCCVKLREPRHRRWDGSCTAIPRFHQRAGSTTAAPTGNGLAIDLDGNAWLKTLLRFTRELVDFSAGRFPVCPPLLRGPGDAAAAMLGGMTYVTGFFDAPAAMRELLELCARTRLAVTERLQAAIPAWNGIHVAGGYPSIVWSRRTVAYHQEDSAAVLNPAIFREFLLPALRTGVRAAEMNFIHLHSACLYPVDILLEDDSFDVLQINVDHRGIGPPVCELIDTFKKIQAAGRPLLLWGEFSGEEWDLVQGELSPLGLSLQPIVQPTETVKEQHEQQAENRQPVDAAEWSDGTAVVARHRAGRRCGGEAGSGQARRPAGGIVGLGVCLSRRSGRAGKTGGCFILRRLERLDRAYRPVSLLLSQGNDKKGMPWPKLESEWQLLSKKEVWEHGECCRRRAEF